MTSRRTAWAWLGLAALTGIAATPLASIGQTVAKEPQRIWMTVGGQRYAITLADTAAARAFAAQLPLQLDMPDLNGNEKHAKLPRSLPTDANRPGRIQVGDLMLWGADTLVVFYLGFDSSYAYTRLGRVEDPASLPKALGPGTAHIRFSKD